MNVYYLFCLVSKLLGHSGLSIDAAKVIFWGSIRFKKCRGRFSQLKQIDYLENVQWLEEVI